MTDLYVDTYMSHEEKTRPARTYRAARRNVARARATTERGFPWVGKNATAKGPVRMIRAVHKSVASWHKYKVNRKADNNTTDAPGYCINAKQMKRAGHVLVRGRLHG